MGLKTTSAAIASTYLVKKSMCPSEGLATLATGPKETVVHLIDIHENVGILILRIADDNLVEPLPLYMTVTLALYLLNVQQPSP
jgi:hypothetical protein